MDNQKSRPGGVNRALGFLLKGCLALGVSAIVVVASPVLIVVFIFIDGNDSDANENTNRMEATIGLKNYAEEYYENHRRYPSKNIVVASSESTLQNYLKTEVVRYYTDKSGKDWFVVQYIHTGAMGWNGSQYSNKPEVLKIPEGAQLGPKGFTYLICNNS